VAIVHDQIGTGYGRPTVASAEAKAVFAGLGIELDDTYTAKAAAQVLNVAAELPKPVLYWHTLSPLGQVLAHLSTPQ
jgi:1-aminocyclopropane-1-carboxylate deaminase/D-cysteine desulfhydrase-like pyridoxal-dependent ACC family enzyme